MMSKPSVRRCAIRPGRPSTGPQPHRRCREGSALPRRPLGGTSRLPHAASNPLLNLGAGPETKHSLDGMDWAVRLGSNQGPVPDPPHLAIELDCRVSALEVATGVAFALGPVTEPLVQLCWGRNNKRVGLCEISRRHAASAVQVPAGGRCVGKYGE
ncbi:hypothetical protein GGTG_06987 [Gaeumannomyces tritici R3-111a-1]|uniref:Uncharacterized protein n=1 Tax=Gaeumannomyces tritici (strain R3-111a-1) TaxID=644352 RepID=J3P0E0_GAET3|nr:hypothetical protein GGTG_06987 [Gaeumannomyces tritici R3-111a-1]EJT77073.1 hypothetical protein GGTG_06987 [Gaeumannomyces tritici R3-111a-1]